MTRARAWYKRRLRVPRSFGYTHRDKRACGFSFSAAGEEKISTPAVRGFHSVRDFRAVAGMDFAHQLAGKRWIFIFTTGDQKAKRSFVRDSSRSRLFRERTKKLIRERGTRFIGALGNDLMPCNLVRYFPAQSLLLVIMCVNACWKSWVKIRIALILYTL